MKNSHKMIAAAAMAGVFAGTTLNAAGIAGQNADGSTTPLQDKAPEKSEKNKCSGKDGCSGKKGEKDGCSGKDGCPGKKEGEKKGEKGEKNACSGKDGCPGKKEEKK